MASRDNDSYSASSRAPRRRLNDGVKQRIVGALVLAALAVIFLPSLFDREGARYVDVTSQIPPAPDIKPITIAEPEPVTDIEPAPPVNEVFQPEFVEQKTPAPDPEAISLAQETKAEPEPAEPETAAADRQPQLPAEKTQLDEQGLPEGWVVQVAAYKDENSAERMRGKLLDAGFRAYTRAVDTPKGRFVRVFVGPKLSRVDAQADKQKLDKLLKADTLILRYKA
ncbi:SPOR domain-containing protein [Microbulbifer pacificus]|uniref:SPOR domain-containing protein n=1 Tax=Microbulbifer pacificus TaxID=407164 RepID=UPI000CF55D13|nr:SPOR domain-containing protein [Microbulbifer pacificus]